MKKRSFWLKFLATVIIASILIFMPIPYYLQGPGEAFELEEMIEVGGEKDNAEGSFMMTTVGVIQATPLTFFAQFLPNYDGVTEDELFSSTENSEEYFALQEFYMDSSTHTALSVAFEAADEPVEFDSHGVYVMQVLPESSFSDSLQMGDIIHKINGKEFSHGQEFVDYVSTIEVGEEVTIEYERDGQTMTAMGELINIPSTENAGIGIGLVDNTAIKTDPKVEINSGDIGGPSAGLMYSLQIYSQLEDANLLGGHRIAGTGAISPDGTVGRIGGIDKKVVTAVQDDADYFLAPDDEITSEMKESNPKVKSNYQVAKEKAETMDTDMEVIPVKDFNDAVEFLNQLN